jgi:hypothetical protein
MSPIDERLRDEKTALPGWHCGENQTNSVTELDRVPARGVAPAVAVPSGQSRELISLRLAG